MEPLTGHQTRISTLLANANADQDLKDMLREELQITEKAIAAPSLPFVRNFERQTEVENVREKSTGAAGQAEPMAGKAISGFSLKN